MVEAPQQSADVSNENIVVKPINGRIVSSSLSHVHGDTVSGADLTEYDSSDDFQELVDTFGLELVELDTHDGQSRTYVWVSDELMIITGANPITGEKMIAGDIMPYEDGYASYMRFEGHEDAVAEALRYTKEHSFTDGAFGEDGFI